MSLQALGLRRDDTFSTTMLSYAVEQHMAEVAPCDGQCPFSLTPRDENLHFFGSFFFSKNSSFQKIVSWHLHVDAEKAKIQACWLGSVSFSVFFIFFCWECILNPEPYFIYETKTWMDLVINVVIMYPCANISFSAPCRRCQIVDIWFRSRDIAV